MKQQIDFLKHSKLFGKLSIVLVVLSWVLIFSGNLKLGIDFAGGTEALVSIPGKIDIQESDLKTVADQVDLKEAEVVTYTFQEGDARQGYFIRSTSKSSVSEGVMRQKAPALKSAIDTQLAQNIISCFSLLAVGETPIDGLSKFISSSLSSDDGIILT